MDAVIDISAQFGGKDAAQALLPHFKALKKAAKGKVLTDFPARDLTFILRVDGEVNAYESPGPCNVDVGKDGEYVSVDLVISVADRDKLEGGMDANPIVAGIEASTGLLARHLSLPGNAEVSLQQTMRAFCTDYLAALG